MQGELLTSLGAIRNQIDAIDAELLELLNKRAALSKEVGRIKQNSTDPIFKPLREHDLLNQLAKKNQGILPDEHMRSIWREILSSSRALQRPQDVAYLGPEGTFSYFAGLEYLGHAANYHPCRDISEIFEMVHDGRCELGVVPLENSLRGTVGVSFDLFLRYPLRIIAELFSRISHSFLSKEKNFSSITTVYSHPQPLAQCSLWLRTHLPTAAVIPVESTASAAQRAAQQDHAAAIGHADLSVLTGLTILASHIEDEPDNWTRFVIIANESLSKSRKASQNATNIADKTSILFTLHDKPGALSNVLECLAKHKVNMRKLESRPLRGETWKYAFFVDVECDLTAQSHLSLTKELETLCNQFRILGSYCTGSQIDKTCKK